jgi:hypothetical protein
VASDPQQPFPPHGIEAELVGATLIEKGVLHQPDFPEPARAK